ncbi:DUF7601 domain-containing protein [Intestinibaculum porci]|uniref:DUF7601 domain-containing protein n=1 Tax=Intestinibaculum porci TaxID=2487118 RepID=UPI00240A9A8F|nr:hypothetical protein [Intestinibaculum porci]MDD6349979.1 hypothetical protein [Intestinibaculum porci]
MKTLRHKCKIVLSIFVSILLMVVSISASLAEGEIKTLTATLIEDQISLNVNVAVNGELPEDATLKVTKVTNKDEHYIDYEKALKAQADQDHYLNNAYSIYNYALMSHDQKIALPAEATITMTYSQPYAPAIATNEDEVSLYRLSSPIKDLTKETDTKIVMSDNTNKVTSLTYKTDTLDPIALTYREKKQSLGNVKVHYVDEKDPTKALADTQTLSASSLNGALNFDTLSKALADNDKTSYTYKRTLFNNSEIAGAKVEKKNDLSYFYYVAKNSQDYTPYKGEGEIFDVDLYFAYDVSEKQDTADQLVNKEDTADELIDKTKDTADELTKKQETSAKEEKDTADQLTKKTESKETEKATSQSSKAEEKDTADELTAASDTKDTADQLTSSTKDTVDQTTAKDTADQVKDNTSSKSTSTKKAVLKRTVLKAPAAAYTSGKLTIVDKFAENGRIEASYSADIPTTATNVKYTWYRTKNRVKDIVTRKNTDGTYNIHYDESKANYVDLSADEGNVTWTKSDNISYIAELSFTYNGEKHSITSDAWNLRYFGQLENGSFENPVIYGTTQYNWSRTSTNYNSATGYAANYKAGDANAPTDTVNGHSYTDGGHYSPDTIWKTTSDWRYRSGGQVAGTDIEIVNARNDSGYQDAYRMRYDNYYSGAKDGKQFAELNAESAGALYQDVMTHPGQPMNYWLSHQARTHYKDDYWRDQWANSMYLVIAPLQEVKDITTQAELENFINKHGGYVGSINKNAPNSDTETYNKDGILIRKIVSNNNGWHDIRHLDGYTPTSSATRFFFVAAGTADPNDKTVGNFLDRVGFSQKLPEPSQDQFNLQVSKTITGLTGEQIENLAKDQEHPLTLTLTNYSGNTPYESLNELKLQFTASKTSDGYTFQPISVKGNEVNAAGTEVAVKKDEKKSITLNWTFANQEIDEKTYKFKVTESDPKLDGYHVTTTNSAENQEGNESLVTKEIDVQKGSNVAFRFSNLYEKLANLTITKQVTGNQADLTKAFKFNVKIKNLSHNKTFTINKTNAESNNPETVASDSQGEITTPLYLKNGQSISINDLVLANEDASYEITEENGSYQASYQIDNGSSVSSAATGEKKINGDDHTIAFTNTKNGEIPTGTQKNAVFTLPLLIAGIGFVLTILKKKNDAE